MPTLLLARPRVRPPAPFVGHLVAVPAPPTVARCAALGLDPGSLAAAWAEDRDGFWRMLGADRDLAGVGTPDRVDLLGLHAPTPWERAWLEWACGRLGVSVPADAEEAGGPFDPSPLEDPLAEWPDAPPVGLSVIFGADPGLEAMGVARALRAELVGTPIDGWPAWCDDTVVLLPGDPARLATWRRVLEAHGLPVRAEQTVSVADTPMARWLLAVVELGGWSRRRVGRDTLRDALLSPLYSLGDARRGDLRALLRTLRRPAVDLGVWRAHVSGHFQGLGRALGDREDLVGAERDAALAELGAREQAVGRRVGTIAQALAAPDSPGFWSALLGLLRGDAPDGLGARGRLRAGGAQDDAPRALEACIAAVEGLAAEAAAGQDRGAGDAGRRRAVLAEVLAGRGMRVGAVRQHGVRLEPWGAWDGVGAARVVLAGLEEGGYPAAPARRTGADRVLGEALGLLEPAPELARQAQVASLAARRAGARLLLSWSATDAQGSATFPGALVAALPLQAGERDPEWVRRRVDAWRAAVTCVEERHLAPPADQVVDPVAASLLAHAAEAPPGLSSEERAAWSAARTAAGADAVVRAARAAPAVGPYTGELGAPLLVDGLAGESTRFSPTALEVLGACPVRYLLGKVLRVERPQDAEAVLDAIESGNLVHAALAAAARASIARGEAWDLAGLDDEALAARQAEVDAAIDRELARLRAEQPTLGAGLARQLADRWKLAARRQLAKEAARDTGGLFPPGPCPSAMDIGEAVLDALIETADGVTAAKELGDWKAVRDGLRWLVEEAAVADLPGSAAEVWSWYQAQGSPAVGLVKKDVTSLAGTTGADRDACIAALRDQVLGKAEKKHAAAEARVRKAWVADRAAVPPRVVAAEWSFGRPADGASDPHSVTTPLQVGGADGRVLRLHGQVDRVDAAAGRPDLAVVDYKTGGGIKSSGALLQGFGRGTDLQLPVYAAAVRALYPADGPGVAGVGAEIGRLAFVRKGVEASLHLAAHGAQWDDGTGATCDTAEALDRHLAHAAERLATGVLALKPRHCPRRGDGGAHCDFEAVCGLDLAGAEARVDPAPQPQFVPPAAEGKGSTPTVYKHDQGLAPLDQPDEPPDPDQAVPAHHAAAARAQDANADVIVSAGAGSGKTTALVGRYGAALEAGAHPDEVLAITFTRKATAEMRSRARLAVRRAQPADEAGRQALRDRLRAVGAAPILTIDALAALLVAELCGEELSVKPSSPGWTNTWLQGRLVDEADAPDADLGLLLDALPPARVLVVLGKLVGAADALTELAALDADGLVARWRARLDAACPGLDADLASLRADRAALEVLDPDLAARDEVLGGLATAVSGAEALGALGLAWAMSRVAPSGKSKNLDPAVAAANARLGQIKSRWTKGLTKGLAGSVKKVDLAALPDALRAEAVQTLAAVRVAVRWEAELRAERRARGSTTFDDVLRAAVALVEDPAHGPALAERFPFRHVMVDELQDTNGLQVRLVAGLCAALQSQGAAPRLFRVGDPKQSIYRFRGAEVDVFEEQLAEAGGHETLSVCWRSRPALTRAVDRLFQRLLDGRVGGAPADPLAAVPWEPLAPRSAEAGAPCVELLVLSGDAAAGQDADGGDDDVGDDGSTDGPELGPAERAVASRVAALLAENPGWTTALLTHSWARASQWGKVLQEAGLPAYVQGGRGLLETPEARAVLDVLDALETEDDDLAWLGMLRGPLVGLSDAGLLCLRRGWGLALADFSAARDADGAPALAPAPGSVTLSRLRHGFGFSATAARAAMAAAGGAPSAAVAEALPRDEARLAALAGWWPGLQAGYGRVPLADTVGTLLSRTGLPTVLYARGAGGDGAAATDALRALSNLRALQSLIDGLSADAGLTPGEAVRQLRQLCAAGDDPADGGANLQPGAAIAVTVVHQAKGLEWDLVVLPDLATADVKGRGDDLEPVRLAWREGEAWSRCTLVGSVVTAATDPFGVTRGIGGIMASVAARPWERAESRRLLYVACTRARERLVLAAPWPTGDAVDIEAKLTKLRASRAPAEAFGLRHAGSWFEDLVVALGLRAPDAGGTVPATDGTWSDGTDFTWVIPDGVVAGQGAGVALEMPTAEALGRAAHAAPSAEVRRLNPSQQRPRGAAPAADVRAGRGGSLDGTSPFSDPTAEGHAVHRLFELWGYRGEVTDDQVAAAAREDLGPGADPAPREAWVRRVLAHAVAGQPELVDGLRRAAVAGRLFHEVTVLVPTVDADGTPARWEGSIDLLWQDEAGAWHLLDYKAAESKADLGGDEPDLGAKVRHYHPQVAAYAAALAGQLPGGAGVASYGLWFLKDGALVQCA